MVELFYSKRSWVLRNQLYSPPPSLSSFQKILMSIISYCLIQDLMGPQHLYGGSVNTALPLGYGHWPVWCVLLLQVQQA